MKNTPKGFVGIILMILIAAAAGGGLYYCKLGNQIKEDINISTSEAKNTSSKQVDLKTLTPDDVLGKMKKTNDFQHYTETSKITSIGLYSTLTEIIHTEYFATAYTSGTIDVFLFKFSSSNAWDANILKKLDPKFVASNKSTLAVSGNTIEKYKFNDSDAVSDQYYYVWQHGDIVVVIGRTNSDGEIAAKIIFENIISKIN